MTSRMPSVTGLARGAFAVFALMTAFYCLLAYVPFTYYQFLRFPHLRWLTFFEQYHHLLAAPLAGLVAWSLWDERHGGVAVAVTRGVAVVLAAGAAVLLFRPLLPNLRNDASSLAWAFAWLVPVAFLAAVDLLAGWSSVVWRSPPFLETDRAFGAAAATAGLLAAVYPVIALARYGSAALGFEPGAWMSIWLTNLLAYLVLFGAAFLILGLVGAAAAFSSRQVAVELVLCNVLLAAIVYALLRFVVLPGISFSGTVGAAFAAAVAVVATAFVAGRKIRARAATGMPVSSGLALALAPFATWRSTWARVVAVVAVPLVAYVLAVRTAVYDWNFIVQKLSVAVVLIIAFATMYGALPSNPRWRPGLPTTIAAALVVLAAFVGIRATGVAAEPLDRYAAHDVAYTLVRDLLSPRPPDADPDFYSFLQANTNISRAVRVEPVEVDLVAELRATGDPVPNVFMIVVDSLRQDYLSPYNDAVAFTPAIDAFAADAIAFRNAFTHYGATGLSQPSIWVGGMLLHQQYTTPFYPMNALDKLLRVHDYERYLSLDTILRVIVPDPDDIVNVDDGRPDKDFDLCSSLSSLQARISARDEPARPIFAYTQPQDLHISSITRAGGAALDDDDYGDFYAPYASRLKRIDTCFGTFIEFLRSSGLYEDSLVILTSDHGDSLGEEGRWGHAYTIFPEIIRIPLLIHLPPRLAEAWAWDADAATFSTDIAPSLYTLLGHGPVIGRSFMGQSLFAGTVAELDAPAATTYLVASSYGPVYGILDDEARTLFIADGVNFIDYLYDLGAGFTGSRRQVGEEDRRRYRDLIRAEIEAIGGFYGYSPGPER